jgi:hypothetical protein
VYVDDNLLFSHTLTIPNRIGQTGLINGNVGGTFDNFKLTSN